MQADHALGPLGDAREVLVGERGGVAGDDAGLGAGLVQLGEDLALEVEALAGGLDDEVGVGEGGEVDGAAEAGEGGVAVGGGEAVLRDEAAEAFFDRGEATVDEGLVDIAQDGGVAALDGDLGDAGAHGAGADDGDLLNLR